MAARKTRTKNKKITLVTKRELFQICLFIGLCMYMAQCSSTKKYDRARLETRVVSSSEMRKRTQIASYAKKYVGTKYKYAGRTPKGFDCSGFTYYVMKNFNVDLVPISREQEKQGKIIPVSKAKPGDLLFFRRSKKGNVFHVAMVVSNGSKGTFVVHSSSSRGVVLDNIKNNSYWKTKIVTARDVL
ncbi:MAG: cell wall-associated NlpC family hydrolase [Paraglaciecola sp.]|jgi:cell wall-associated NlpC family hydrolase